MSKTWDTLELDVETSDYNSAEHVNGDVFYRRWFSNYFNLVAGGSYFAEFEKDKTRGVIGVGYTLPMLMETNLLVDHKGQLRLDLEKRFQWTSAIFSELEASFRQEAYPEFGFSLMYGPAWSWAAGLMVSDGELGAGVHYKF